MSLHGLILRRSPGPNHWEQTSKTPSTSLLSSFEFGSSLDVWSRESGVGDDRPCVVFCRVTVRYLYPLECLHLEHRCWNMEHLRSFSHHQNQITVHVHSLYVVDIRSRSRLMAFVRKENNKTA